MTKSNSAPLDGSRQVAADLRNKIHAGHWRSGERLPSTRTLAERYHLSLPTIQSVFRGLEAEELIACRPRRRAIVCFRGASRSQHRSSQTTIAVIRGLSPDQLSYCHAHENRIDRILRSAQEVLRAEGLHFVTLAYEGDHRTLRRQVFPKLDKLADELAGVINCSAELNETAQQEAADRGLPWLTLAPTREGPTGNFVAPDFRGAGRVAGQLFAHRGTRRLLLAGAHPDHHAERNAELFSGVFEGLLLHQQGPLPQLELLPCARGSEQDFEQCKTLFADYLDQAELPDAILASDDLLAIGAIDVLSKRGVAVPEEVVVMGAAGLELSAHCRPSLTVLQQPMDQIGQEAARLMVQMIRGSQREVSGRRLPCELIGRQSLPIPGEDGGNSPALQRNGSCAALPASIESEGFVETDGLAKAV